MNQPTQNLALLESERIAKMDLVKAMSGAAQLDPNAFISTVMRQCFDVEVTKEQFLSFLMVANQYDLDPLTKEIHGFAKGGKVVPIVGIDGWLSMINKRPELDGIEYEDHRNETGGIEAITCVIYRKDRERPTRVTEYLAECQMETSPWKKWPTRMLRHKATIQCARTSFSFSGIYDPDEGQRIMQGDSDIIGHAVVVEDGKGPQDAATRIVSKIAHKAEVEQFAPPGDAQEAGQAIVEGESLSIKDTDGHKPEGEIVTDDGEIIPGLKKASEIEQPKAKAKEPYIDPETGEVVPDDVGIKPGGSSKPKKKK